MTDLLSRYNFLDKTFNLNINEKYEYLVNFSQTKESPIHRWYYFVEGYSPLLVKAVFNHLGIQKKNCLVFDPFSGSGTTLLTSKELGMQSLGFEINPFSAFMISVKTKNYSDKDIENVENFSPPKREYNGDVYEKYELKIINNLFDRQTLEKIELLKEKVNNIDEEKTRNLLYMAILTILPIVSNYRKGGNGLKRKKINLKLDPFIEFEKKRREIVEDLRNNPIKGLEPVVINDTCLSIDDYANLSFDVSLFSPPYANCFDPFEVYKTELWVGEFVSNYDDLRERRRSALTSNLNANLKKEIYDFHRTETLDEILKYLEKQVLWDKRIPKMLDTYFYEMHELLGKIKTLTKPGGYCIIVVGNSAYGNLAIPTDLLLGEMAELVGFKVKEIIESRKNETSSQQHRKLGDYTKYLRESIVILQR